MKFEFTWDSKELAALTGSGIERAVVRALRKAGGDGIRAARAELKRGTRARVAIQAGYLADRALPTRFPRGNRLEDLVWGIGVSDEAIPLGRYPRRQVKRGVSVVIERGKRKIIKSAFLQHRKRTERLSVFKRKGKTRYAMGHLLGPSLADLQADGRVPRAALNRGATVLGAAFRRLLPLELDKVR